MKVVSYWLECLTFCLLIGISGFILAKLLRKL